MVDMESLYSSSLPWFISANLHFYLLTEFYVILIFILQSVINKDMDRDIDGDVDKDIERDIDK